MSFADSQQVQPLHRLYAADMQEMLRRILHHSQRGLIANFCKLYSS
jgi:hypothetical protein